MKIDDITDRKHVKFQGEITAYFACECRSVVACKIGETTTCQCGKTYSLVARLLDVSNFKEAHDFVAEVIT